MGASRRREFAIGMSVLTGVIALGLISTALQRRADAQAAAAVQVPMFEVDPLWPKPLPNNWVTGNNIGIALDSSDNVWMIHRVSGVANSFKGAGTTCCKSAPPVMGFDQAGNLIGSWGGAGPGLRVAPERARTVDRLQGKLLDWW